MEEGNDVVEATSPKEIKESSKTEHSVVTMELDGQDISQTNAVETMFTDSNLNNKQDNEQKTSKDEEPSSSYGGDSGIFDISPHPTESQVEEPETEATTSLKRSTEKEPITPIRFKKVKKGSRKFRSKNLDETSESVPVEAEANTSSTLSSINHSISSSSSYLADSSSDSSRESDEEREEDKPELTDDELWLKKDTDNLLKNDFAICKEFVNREYGKQTTHKFTKKICSSRHMVTKLRKLHTLNGHEGCVNSLNFNDSGTLLASGSDDLMIKIWNWERPKAPAVSFASGHRANVFQSKFLPGCNDATVVSCARDGQVRVADISSTGTCRATKKVVQHCGSAHKLAIDSGGSKTLFYSCGEDGDVYRIDLRDEKPATKIISIKSKSEKLPLYSIHVNPRNEYEFAVSGRDQWARLYDQRKIADVDDMPMKKFCPHHLVKPQRKTYKANITCLMYNYDGTELLCSYNDDDIYLFDTTHSSGDDYSRKYKGHRNNATVKGVNFYGPCSEFVVSGSDCGNVFIWEKKTSQIVQFMDGDEEGVVNVLEPHPHLPVLATSGLDNNVKIFSPIGEAVSTFPSLKQKILSNRRERHEESYSSQIDGQLLWFLMRSLQTRVRQNSSQDRTRNMPNPATQGLSDDSSDDEDSSNDSDDDPQDPCVTS